MIKHTAKQVKDCYTHFASGQKVPRSSASQASADSVLQDTYQYNEAAVWQDFAVSHEEKENFQRTPNRVSDQNHFQISSAAHIAIIQKF